MGCPTSRLDRRVDKDKPGPKRKPRKNKLWDIDDSRHVKKERKQDVSPEEEEESPLLSEETEQTVAWFLEPSPDGKSPPFNGIPLGKGSYGAVYRVKTKGGKEYALKVFHAEDIKRAEKNWKRELKALKAFQDVCDEKHILCLVGSTERKEGYFILTQLLVDYISLYDWWQKKKIDIELTEEKALHFVETLVTALRTFRDRGWKHGDVAERNVMIHKTHATAGLIDLGLAKHELGKDEVRTRELVDVLVNKLFYHSDDPRQSRLRFMKTLSEETREFLFDSYRYLLVPLAPVVNLTSEELDQIKSILHGYDSFHEDRLRPLQEGKNPDHVASSLFMLYHSFIQSEMNAFETIVEATRYRLTDKEYEKELESHIPCLTGIPFSRFNDRLPQLKARGMREFLNWKQLVSLHSMNDADDGEFLEDVKKHDDDGKENSLYQSLHRRLEYAHVTAIVVLDQARQQYVASAFVWPSTSRPGWMVMSDFCVSIKGTINDDVGGVEMVALHAAVEFTRQQGFESLYVLNPTNDMEAEMKRMGILSHSSNWFRRLPDPESVEYESSMSYQSVHLHFPLDFKWPWMGLGIAEMANVFLRNNFRGLHPHIEPKLADSILAMITTRHPYHYLVPVRTQSFLFPFRAALERVKVGILFSYPPVGFMDTIDTPCRLGRFLHVRLTEQSDVDEGDQCLPLLTAHEVDQLEHRLETALELARHPPAQGEREQEGQEEEEVPGSDLSKLPQSQSTFLWLAIPIVATYPLPKEIFTEIHSMIHRHGYDVFSSVVTQQLVDKLGSISAKSRVYDYNQPPEGDAKGAKTRSSPQLCSLLSALFTSFIWAEHKRALERLQPMIHERKDVVFGDESFLHFEDINPAKPRDFADVEDVISRLGKQVFPEQTSYLKDFGAGVKEIWDPLKTMKPELLRHENEYVSDYELYQSKWKQNIKAFQTAIVVLSNKETYVGSVFVHADTHNAARISAIAPSTTSVEKNVKFTPMAILVATDWARENRFQTMVIDGFYFASSEFIIDLEIFYPASDVRYAVQGAKEKMIEQLSIYFEKATWTDCQWPWTAKTDDHILRCFKLPYRRPSDMDPRLKTELISLVKRYPFFFGNQPDGSVPIPSFIVLSKK